MQNENGEIEYRKNYLFIQKCNKSDALTKLSIQNLFYTPRSQFFNAVYKILIKICGLYKRYKSTWFSRDFYIYILFYFIYIYKQISLYVLLLFFFYWIIRRI